MNTKEIEQKARRLKMLKTKRDAMDAEIDQLEADLKKDLEKKGLEELHAGPFTIIWRWIHSTRFDSKRCKEENPDIYNLYAVSNSYRKFSVV